MPSREEHGLEFTDAQRKTVENLFTQFDEQDVAYVIPRGYRELPNSVPGGDLDILIDEEVFDQGIGTAKEVGFESRDRKRRKLVSLGSSALRKPVTALNMVFTDPAEVSRHLREAWNNKERGRAGYEEKKLLYDGLQLHLFNHLAYISPLDGRKIRVDPAVEAHMLEHRKKENGWSVPEEPDEIVHLLCRGIFDYDGEFPQYYKKRCDEIFERVVADPLRMNKLQELLNLVFFSADEVVLRLCEEGRYDDMKRELRRFADY